MKARALVALLSAPLALAVASTATAAPPTSAADNVAECARTSGRLLVDIQIDSSSSLQSSDPEDRRVDGVSGALRGLADSIERPSWEGPSPRAEVLFQSFAGGVNPAPAESTWRPVDQSTLDGLLRRADRYAERDHGRDTDYVLALEGARSALNRQAAAITPAGSPEPCKVILFLSDGGFHIGDRSGAESLPSTVPYAEELNLEVPGAGARAVAAGRHFLCDRDGLMDKIAGDGTVLFTVALKGAKFSDLDRDRLKAMTVGEGGRARCGSRVSPRTGRFIEARDSSELFLIFRGLLEPHGGCWDEGVCPNPSQFRTERGMRGFVLAATSPGPEVELKLTDPEQRSETFSSGGSESLSLGGAEIQQSWIKGRALELRAEFDPRDEAWLGTWRFQFFAPGEEPVPAYDLKFLSGLRPRTGEVPPLAPGGVAKVPVHLVDQLGNPATEGLAESARLRVSVVDSSEAERPAHAVDVGPGQFQVPFRVPSEGSEGPWELRAVTYFPNHNPRVEESVASLELGSTEPPPKPPWLLIAAAVLLVLLIVLFLDYRYRLGRARFGRGRRLRYFSAEATLTPRGAVLLDPDPEELDFNDFRDLPLEAGSGTTVIELEPFLLEAHTPRRFRGRPVAEASAGEWLLLGGNAEGDVFDGGELGRFSVPLDLAGIWLVAFEPPRAEADARGRLVLFTDQRARDEAGSALHEAAKKALDEQDWRAFRNRPEADEDEDSLDIDGIDWESIRKERHRAE